MKVIIAGAGSARLTLAERPAGAGGKGVVLPAESV
jgi:hypothetical protein